MNKRKIKRSRYYISSVTLIFFLCFIFLVIYLKKVNPKLIIIGRDLLQKNIYDQITDISKMIGNDYDSKELLNIYKNSEGQILYASYDMKKSYEILNKISNELNNQIITKNLIIKEPLFISSDYSILSNLGPKISLKINYLSMNISNINTRITNYGINNALVEIYITINIKGRVLTPVNNKDIDTKYDMLISSVIINGKVPSFYGGTIKSSSVIFDIPIKI